MNSSVSGLVPAIENERWCSVPGILILTYWPGLYSSGSVRARASGTRCQTVSGSTASTDVEHVRGGTPPWMISSS